MKDLGGPTHLALQDQVAWVTQVCGQKIKFDQGCAGVIVLDFDDGRKRVKVGVSSTRENLEDWFTTSWLSELELDCCQRKSCCCCFFEENLAHERKMILVGTLKQLVEPSQKP